MKYFLLDFILLSSLIERCKPVIKRLLVPALLAFPFYPAFAQKMSIDSLLQVAISQGKHTKMASSPNRDSLLKQFSVTKPTPARIKLIYDIIYNYGLLSPKQALYYHKKILDIAMRENDLVCEAIILSELGATHINDGDNTKGYEMISQALILAKKTGSKQALGIVYNNLGYCNPEDINSSKSYYQKALKLSRASGDDLFACFELVNLSLKYQALHQADSAKYYLMQSFDLSVRKNMQQAIPLIMLSLGDLQTNTTLKLRCYRAALNMPFTKIDATSLLNTQNAIAIYYKAQGNIDSSLVYAKKAYNTANALFLNRKIWPAKFLAELYEGRNADSSLKYLKIHYDVRDSMVNLKKVQAALSLASTEQQREREMAAQKLAYQTNLKFYLLLLLIIFLIVLAFIFWRNTRSKHKANLLLHRQKEQVQLALKELKLTQQQLIQSEKMASLGELTAGIAHEIQNPLNFVNNFSEVSIEMLNEMELEFSKGDSKEGKAIAADIKQNLEKIKHHGKRADSIVKGMLQHSRAGNSIKEPTDINKLADEYLRLAYHGLRAKEKSFDAEMKTTFDSTLPLINIVAQDIGRVLLNLFTNSFYALQQRQKLENKDYKPVIKVTTARKGDHAEIIVWDNGIGIPDNLKEKILQPFFTTKPTGEGTGLGLSLSYDIVVKEHNGKIDVDSKNGHYTTFTVSIPVS